MHFCYFIPPHVLQSIAGSESADEQLKTAARTTLECMNLVHDERLSNCHRPDYTLEATEVGFRSVP